MYLTLEEFSLYNIQDFTLTQKEFEKYRFNATCKVDKYTQNRLTELEEIPEGIKRIVTEIICLMYTNDVYLSQLGAVKSVSNDGYQVTYQDNKSQETADNLEMSIYNLVTEYARDYCWRGLD